MPWEVGVRELLARPVDARPRPGAEPVHGSHARPVVLAGAVGRGRAAGFAALIPVLFDRGPPLPGYAVINRLSGISFMACGLLAWRQRPDSAVGRLLTVTGFGVLLSAGARSSSTRRWRSPRTCCSATCGSSLFVALFLSFVTGGRLTSRLDVVLVGAFLVDLLVLPFAMLLFLPDEEQPAARVRPTPGRRTRC